MQTSKAFFSDPRHQPFNHLTGNRGSVMCNGEINGELEKEQDQEGDTREARHDNEKSANAEPRMTAGLPAGYPNNRRHISDRRSWKLAQYPLVDSDGTLIIADRRQQADRRLSSIIVEDTTHDL
jgi:hypothetical protein